jgi:hypothetical protein
MKGFVLTGILLILLFPAPAQKPVSFLSEYIDFKIEGDYFTVNGLYTFLNRSDKSVKAGIMFPFALPAALVDSIGVINLNEAKAIDWKKRERDIVFNVQLNPIDTVTVHLYYRQPLARINTYILTSTRSWGTALEEAVYTLTIYKNLTILSFSLPPDSSVTDDVYRTYFWTKADFSPPSDFEVIIDR